MKLSREQIEGLVRHILTGIGGVLLTLGLLEEAILMDIIGVSTTIIGIIWSLRNKTKNKEA